MRHAGMMRWRVTPYVLTAAKNASGGVEDTWTAQSPVWGSFKSGTDTRRVGAGRYEYPATHSLTVDSAAWAVAGSRVAIAGVTYDVLGSDPLGEQTVLDLKEVTR